nr:MAG TPA: hypothetical protein [Bacteriophage sp.]
MVSSRKKFIVVRELICYILHIFDMLLMSH